MKIISFVLYERTSFENRPWDPQQFEQYRYWFNIPALLLVWNELKPDFNITLHISNDSKNNPLYNTISEMVKVVNGNIDLIDLPYNKFQPSLWRYKPIFNKNNEIVYSRDIDSLPNMNELKSMQYFENNDELLIHTIRSHTNHTTLHTTMLGGLSGFKPNKLNENISFEEFYTKYNNSEWEVDQAALRNYFLFDKGNDFINNHFFNCGISTQYHNVAWNERGIDRGEVWKNENIKETELIKILNQLTQWSGQPLDVRKEYLDFILNNTKYGKEFRTILNKNIDIKKFYL